MGQAIHAGSGPEAVRLRGPDSCRARRKHRASKPLARHVRICAIQLPWTAPGASGALRPADSSGAGPLPGGLRLFSCLRRPRSGFPSHGRGPLTVRHSETALCLDVRARFPASLQPAPLCMLLRMIKKAGLAGSPALLELPGTLRSQDPRNLIERSESPGSRSLVRAFRESIPKACSSGDASAPNTPAAAQEAPEPSMTASLSRPDLERKRVECRTFPRHGFPQTSPADLRLKGN